MNACFHLQGARERAATLYPEAWCARIFSRARLSNAFFWGVVVWISLAFQAHAVDLRIGIVGTDSSHSPKFAQAFNDPKAPERVPGARIVCAFKGGSPDMERSRSRVDAFGAELRDKYGVDLVDSIAELVKRCDAIMILSVDGRAHLPQAKEIFGAGKPVFIDKPLGGNLADSIALVRLARETKTPLFSCSNYRFADGLAKMKAGSPGRLRFAQVYGPATIEPLMPDFYFYVVHVTESLYTLLGPGCVSVARTSTKDGEIATGVWSDGRMGVVTGLHGTRVGNGALAMGERKVVSETLDTNFPALANAILIFFRTGEAPVKLAETLEIMAFMQAADESKRRGGAPVALAEIMAMNGGENLAASTMP